MKTSLDIPEEDLGDLLRFTKAKTKREAIVTAVKNTIGAGGSLPWSGMLELLKRS